MREKRVRQSAWETARQNDYERHDDYSKLKKNMTILQNMYQAKVNELNDYKIMCDEQRRELKELKDMVKWHEDKHISKVLDHKDRNSFVYGKGIKSDETEYAEL